MNIEDLRQVFKDVRQHIGLGLITQIGLSDAGTSLRVKVNMLPDEREIVAKMTFSAVGNLTGFVDFPEVNDLVVVAFAHDPVDLTPNHDDAFVIARLPSSEEPLPVLARQGHSVAYAHPGKKLYVGSDTKTGIARPGKDPVQPLVLGTVLVSALTDFLNAFLNAGQIGLAAGGIPVYLDPGIRTSLVAAMNTYLTQASTNIVSQIGFTERGTE